MPKTPAPEDRPVYYFVHIPKTAGQSLRTHLWRHIDSPKTRIVPTFALDIDTDETLKGLRQEQISEVDLVVGHGVSRRSADFFPGRPSRFFTVLRDPVDLAISQYNWTYREPEMEAPPFEDWVHQIRNRMCVWLVNRFEQNNRKSPRAQIHDGQNLFEQAADTLNRFFCVGIQNNLEKSLQPVFSGLNTPSQIKSRAHISGVDFPKRIFKTPAYENHIRELCAQDVLLFDHFAKNHQS